jgi:AraC-like DNA-binding protein
MPVRGLHSLAMAVHQKASGTPPDEAFDSRLSGVTRGIYPVIPRQAMTASLVAPFFTGWEFIGRGGSEYGFDNASRQDNRGVPFVFIQYIIRGTAYFTSAQGRMPITAGHAVLVPVPSPTHLHVDVSQAEHEFLWINMLGSPIHSWANDLTARHGFIFRMGEHSPALNHLINLYLLGHHGYRQSSLLPALMENFRFTIEVARHLEGTADELTLVEQAWRCIKDGYADQNFGVAKMALKLGVSRGHLARVFHEETGRTLIHAIKDWRLDQATILLAQGIHPNKAGIACGYSNPAYFSRDFRRRTGRSPKSVMPQA